MMVAAFDGAKFPEHEFELHPGDSLFVYTDGIPEATTTVHNLFFGTDRLVDALNEVKDETPEKTIKNVKQAIVKFADGAEQFDDITMLCLKYNGPEQEDE